MRDQGERPQHRTAEPAWLRQGAAGRYYLGVADWAVRRAPTHEGLDTAGQRQPAAARELPGATPAGWPLTWGCGPEAGPRYRTA